MIMFIETHFMKAVKEARSRILTPEYVGVLYLLSCGIINYDSYSKHGEYVPGKLNTDNFGDAFYM